MNTQPAPRFSIEQSIAAVCRVHGHQRRFAGKTKNISNTGVYFYAGFRPPLGSTLDLVMMFPSELTRAESLPVVFRCKVVRVEPNAAGEQTGVAVVIESCQPLAMA